MQDITLIGYGKMGKMLAALAPDHGCRVVSIVDPGQDGCLAGFSDENLAPVCLEFSHPSAVMGNLQQLAELGRNVVVGTTGWFTNLPQVEDLVARHGIGLLYGANFSIGMNIYTRVIRYATGLCDRFPGYDVGGWEIHHNQKADSPSGTALQIADAIVGSDSRKQTAVFDKLNRKSDAAELHFASVRVGSVPGTHSVLFDSEADSLEFTHRARSRSCFAVGALRAATWIAGRTGIFTFQQMMEDLLC